jgi:pSer/pThr/pTyr-binding forkhead associated (FHA) protein
MWLFMYLRNERRVMAFLYRIQADGAPAESWPVGNQPLVVGRGDCAEALVGDDALSRSHFLVVKEGPDFVLADLDSQNGTSVNGKRVSGHKLRSGDVIHAGQSVFYFSSERLALHARPLAAMLGLTHTKTDLRVPTVGPALRADAPRQTVDIRSSAKG